MKNKKDAEWVYGKSPHPANWHETADLLKKNHKKTKKPNNWKKDK